MCYIGTQLARAVLNESRRSAMRSGLREVGGRRIKVGYTYTRSRVYALHY